MRAVAGGLRGRLVLGAATLVALCLAIAFASVYTGTRSELRRQAERDLRADLDGFVGPIAAAPDAPAAAQAARRATAAQPFRASSRLLFAVIGSGSATVTNEPDLLQTRAGSAESPARRDAERRAGQRLLAAPPGLSEAQLPDAGRLRVLVRRVQLADGTVVRVGAGESVDPTERAQDVVLRAFGLAGALGLLAAVLGATALAGGLTAPLRRMASVAGRVDSGDLSPRMRAPSRSAVEVRRLADTFDRMLDRVEDAFGRQATFVADASHELRTPLTVISGQLEVLARQADPDVEDVRRVERLVRVEVERMQRLVEDLLVLTRAEEAAFLQRRDVDLEPLLEELVETGSVGARRHVERGELADVRVQADPDRLAQAVRNLVRNALEHTAADGRVRVQSTLEDEAVVVSVDDDGPGIPEADRALVFDRFHRVDAARARRDGGAGLGLAIVAAIAEAHGGSAFCEASPLGGARVGFRLPR